MINHSNFHKIIPYSFVYPDYRQMNELETNMTVNMTALVIV